MYCHPSTGSKEIFIKNLGKFAFCPVSLGYMSPKKTSFFIDAPFNRDDTQKKMIIFKNPLALNH